MITDILLLLVLILINGVFAGTISGGGPLVRVNSRSGAVRITIAVSPSTGRARSFHTRLQSL